MAHPTTISASALPGSSLILRNALIFASVLNHPVRIIDFRRGRNKPGIQPADSALLRLVDRVQGGGSADVRIGEEDVRWEAGDWEGGTTDDTSSNDGRDASHCSADWNASPGPTTSLPILLQGALPTLLFADRPSHLHFLAGSTDVSGAPPLDHTINILCHFLQTHLGVSAPSIALRRRGSPPLGRAEVSAEIQPLAKGQILNPVTLLEQGEVTAVRGQIVVTGKMPTHALTRAHDAIAEVLSRRFPMAEVALELTITREAAVDGDRGELYITIWSETSTGCRLAGSSGGERGKRIPEEAGREAAEALLHELRGGGCVDSWMQVCWLLCTQEEPS